MNEATKIVGIRIREIRKVKNISQETLAVLADVNRTHMGRIERGDKSPTVATLEKISTALKCPISSLFKVETT